MLKIRFYLSVKQLFQDLSLIFENVKEFNDLQTIVDFIISINKLMKRLDSLFTVKSLFGNSLLDFFERNLNSDAYLSTYELLNSKLNFQKVNHLFIIN